MRVEVVFALPDRQVLEALDVEAGATVAEAISQSGIERRFPEIDMSVLQVGIWGRPAERSRVLREDDRVEIYRPLETDPREARRLKAGV
ncbi:MAG: RnfH family protein [Woeseiaceae bacterium]|nr:RnfH family protein [Gammaproteobacteria bacterium]NNK26163.1 RnfH family protein [Woeseiaceae bacterium]